jgi:hypothetical protein
MDPCLHCGSIDNGDHNGYCNNCIKHVDLCDKCQNRDFLNHINGMSGSYCLNCTNEFYNVK